MVSALGMELEQNRKTSALQTGTEQRRGRSGRGRGTAFSAVARKEGRTSDRESEEGKNPPPRGSGGGARPGC